MSKIRTFGARGGAVDGMVSDVDVDVMGEVWTCGGDGGGGVALLVK